MAETDPKYPVPSSPKYRVHDIRAIQDEDFVDATRVVNPVVEAVLESVEYLNQKKAELREGGTVPVEQLPIGVPGGVASLGPEGKVPPEQLPKMDYVPNDAKGRANGVVQLGADGKVPEDQLPALGGHTAQGTAPSNTKLLWIDTADSNILKFYDTASGTWKPVGAVWS